MSETVDLTAELPGTFYIRESPSSDPYVTVGGRSPRVTRSGSSRS